MRTIIFTNKKQDRLEGLKRSLTTFAGIILQCQKEIRILHRRNRLIIF